jgi:hypothetical protein
MSSITKELANEYFCYDNGHLIWKKSTGPRSVPGTKITNITREGYVCVQFMNKTYKVHQLIFLLHHGYIPKEIDHINNIRSDNRIENLREVTRSFNCANQSVQRRSISGYKGVTKSKNNMWRARIKHLQREIYIGLFDTPEAAAHAYNIAALNLFGNFAKLNSLGAHS